ncbi:NAD(P)H-dependent oxidoreductase [Saccharopolyspora sp. K220]|uniref:FMN-dependent NADH-azoreductase n=1 Tax=Saccharopolyspora soli TaxID=2926618 RepID=UPI001F588190|nr:NAD(P)H-dependent oxidoreductase [Saccharopolyspora soli]MCI2424268.1 NAD(P)H-dependent oxidoreductase [Saccharopolyspora soli]
MNLLAIDVSPRLDNSYSRNVSSHLVASLSSPDTVVVRRDLAAEPPPHLDAVFLDAYLTPSTARTEAQRDALAYSDMLVDEFLAADTIVISTPMWNFGVPSTLKAWIDHIVRLGRTVDIRNGSFEGLAFGRKMYVVVGSGDLYTRGPLAMMDMLTPSIRAAFSFIGLHDIEFIRVEGTNVPGSRTNALPRAIAEVDRQTAA